MSKYLHGSWWLKLEFAFGFAGVFYYSEWNRHVSWVSADSCLTQKQMVCVITQVSRDRLLCASVCWWPDNKTRVFFITSFCVCNAISVPLQADMCALWMVRVCHCGALAIIRHAPCVCVCAWASSPSFCPHSAGSRQEVAAHTFPVPH